MNCSGLSYIGLVDCQRIAKTPLTWWLHLPKEHMIFHVQNVLFKLSFTTMWSIPFDFVQQWKFDVTHIVTSWLKIQCYIRLGCSSCTRPKPLIFCREFDNSLALGALILGDIEYSNSLPELVMGARELSHSPQNIRGFGPVRIITTPML